MDKIAQDILNLAKSVTVAESKTAAENAEEMYSRGKEFNISEFVPNDMFFSWSAVYRTHAIQGKKTLVTKTPLATIGLKQTWPDAGIASKATNTHWGMRVKGTMEKGGESEEVEERVWEGGGNIIINSKGMRLYKGQLVASSRGHWGFIVDKRDTAKIMKSLKNWVGERVSDIDDAYKRQEKSAKALDKYLRSLPFEKEVLEAWVKSKKNYLYLPHNERVHNEFYEKYAKELEVFSKRTPAGDAEEVQIEIDKYKGKYFSIRQDDQLPKSAEALIRKMGGYWQSEKQGLGALKKLVSLGSSPGSFTDVARKWNGKAVGMVHGDFSKPNAKGFQSATGYVFDTKGIVAKYYLWYKEFGGGYGGGGYGGGGGDDDAAQRLEDIYDDFGSKRRNIPEDMMDEVRDLENRTRRNRPRPSTPTIRTGAKLKWTRRDK